MQQNTKGGLAWKWRSSGTTVCLNGIKSRHAPDENPSPDRKLATGKVGMEREETVADIIKPGVQRAYRTPPRSSTLTTERRKGRSPDVYRKDEIESHADVGGWSRESSARGQTAADIRCVWKEMEREVPSVYQCARRGMRPPGWARENSSRQMSRPP